MESLVFVLVLVGFLIWLYYGISKYERILWYLKKDMSDNLYTFHDVKLIKHYIKIIDEVLR